MPPFLPAPPLRVNPRPPPTTIGFRLPARNRHGGLYVFRMIDADGFFHSADALALEDGWTVKIQGDGLQAISLEISDPDGVVRHACPVFSARL